MKGTRAELNDITTSSHPRLLTVRFGFPEAARSLIVLIARAEARRRHQIYTCTDMASSNRDLITSGIRIYPQQQGFFYTC